MIRSLRVSGAMAFAALCVIAVPAQAQLSSGTSGFSSAPVNASEAEYWQMMGRLGQCLANSKEEASRTFLAAPIDSEAENAAFAALFHRQSNRCMGNFVSASLLRAHVRGVVAEGLIEQLPEDRRAALVATPPAEPDTIANLHDFARCYVAMHPAESMTLLRETRLQSAGELAYIQQIAGDFGACLPEGRDVSLRPLNVRLALAEALHHAATSEESDR
ncbi:hypothetical protein GRI62_05565 [Erythrobacter arachoides]|uniref:Uncharacterized protein n=1 Tax=Aurantiacibacter arachoides TaxID=1850444 RepID=A0A844ZY56_9SPHN|nr:hypothetical protein [Aurantiacibacter arachoides]MXO93073.1 hypothetical protein [Aurantiacibacter arachoides]GGD52244.1 hypothetical protein GCM10011411_10120 [Aurantiacibacter arachoides]